MVFIQTNIVQEVSRTYFVITNNCFFQIHILDTAIPVSPTMYLPIPQDISIEKDFMPH